MQQQIVTVPNIATIQTIAPLADQVRSAMAESDDVVIDASAAEIADLGFLQLIEAARGRAKADGAAFRLTAPANPAIRTLLHRAGMLAAPSPDDIDFWFHGDLPR